MSKKMLVILPVAIVAFVGWYAFRPERLVIDQKVNEQFPTASAASNKLASGQFHSGAHETKGTATVFQLADGKKTLRLTDFATSNGPDVHVYLVAADDAKDNDMVTKAGFIDVGSLKGNIGDQNYDLPANADLTKYRAVTIWCISGTLTLAPKMASSSVTSFVPSPVGVMTLTFMRSPRPGLLRWPERLREPLRLPEALRLSSPAWAAGSARPSG